LSVYSLTPKLPYNQGIDMALVVRKSIVLYIVYPNHKINTLADDFSTIRPIFLVPKTTIIVYFVHEKKGSYTD